MEGDRRAVLRSRSSTQFKKKGANKKGKWGDFGEEFRENMQVPNPSDTVYRILCPSRKIGSVIGKGGGIIKALREKSRSKITVSNSIPGSDERVIMIYSPPDKPSKKESDEESMPPHCPAQDALMKVHDRIIEEDLSVGAEGDEDKDIVVTARLLVPNSMVGCLLGKGGDVIQRLRSETGASIRVLPAEHLPTCALGTDELVQIQGKSMVVKKALYEVSTLLHENPRKEKALNVALPFRAPGFPLGGPPVGNMPLSRNALWSPRDPAHMPPPPWAEDYAGHPGFMPGGFDDGLTRPGVEPSGEFSIKILCSASKIGGVIGKGGINVRQLEQETGTSIHVEDPSASSEERIIRVSAFETLRNPRSQTIDAILLLQNKVSEVSEKGTITTRLLVPSSKVGCLLGQGGSIINEMRRRTQADIRVYSKDEKPEFASEDEELVQVSGSFAVAKDAMGEIASRLRARCLRDGSTGAESAPPRPVHGYGPLGNFPRGGPPIPGPIGVGSSVSYDGVKKRGRDDTVEEEFGKDETEEFFRVRYQIPNSPVEVRYPSSGIGSTRGGTYSDTPELLRRDNLLSDQ
ncbi:hypothetical protein Cgig2_022387 [Carnegiea gigantea]|uniref:K Homology domain-containing protein n=1 Tax=Carnegiea gigantea TaxID=171969 RepID=A0A9Q1KFE4_9CARY|nr:hypothetical protein Cgig2_022387 [Carnegiea gigantea]